MADGSRFGHREYRQAPAALLVNGQKYKSLFYWNLSPQLGVLHSLIRLWPVYGLDSAGFDERPGDNGGIFFRL